MLVFIPRGQIYIRREVGRLGVGRACPVAEETASALEAVKTAMTSFDGMFVIDTNRIATTTFDSEGTRDPADLRKCPKFHRR